MKTYTKINAAAFNKRNSNYRKKYPEKQVMHVQKRNALKAQRMPKWLSPQQLAEIAQFYKDSAYLTTYTKTSMHVDHIVPLRGKIVSGLHVPWNLQIIPAIENCSKGNKFGL